MGSTTTGSLALAGLAALGLAGCGGLYVSPLAPPPYRAEIPAAYDRAWAALVRALARENVPLRAIARDSGVIASDDFVAPIGVYADCGRLGDDRVEGEALVAFTIFVERDTRTTQVQVNAKMRTQAHRKGGSGTLRPTPVYPCASTGRFEANLLDAVRDLVRE
ncbi:MAG: hypothetical protein A3E31_12310 [Candidatus Rokubacteria bacterium RIFCSPHIGHO2_12_FULL_73_22]|nr:MAG: hypothetical protein A3D33_11080 [Candidatus Rokubacteria bacterium RIFCSPHIGHO2_02_FULL_73_26]OGL03670.1 MAG: hypothetical protein A3E31_12310 [Candidatus Rokubacteria bacterium RIFCSPHIGHO2_12_FULL_73_22]OGL08253.1 MAG: hypothetical protein A3I14_07100 [Candidatus Rokubacteria bacterium RIFCSPLOWO2_02_FULL_73_56]OGL28656.1 MAG: hypothetical protein A3G44_16990 [Candidatus Rokubacteria bacterium RIFCSPLOWO2_12_FULL_73_47]